MNPHKDKAPAEASGEPAAKPAAASATSFDEQQLVDFRLVTDGPDAGLCYVTLNRPEKLNSLTPELLEQLIATATRVRADRRVRVVILSGAGRSFSAGLDFAAAFAKPAGIVANFLPRPWRGTNQFQEAPWAWRRLPVPVIAAVHGHCLGGGLQIAAAADYRITTADATWSVLEAKWGLVPDMSGIHALKQILPIDQAKRLAMTGEMFDGTRAVELGLASEVAEDPLAAAEELARRVLDRSPDAVAATKKLFDNTWTAGPRWTFLKERLAQAPLLVSKNAAIARTRAQQSAKSDDDAALKPYRPRAWWRR